MPACSVEREVIGTTALYRVCGKFEGACAWDLSSRIEREPLSSLVIDFSQVNHFVDYGIAVLSSALLSLGTKQFTLRGLRQHQSRLFKYFGVAVEEAKPTEPEHERQPPLGARHRQGLVTD